jgi:hypothetical protein
MSQFVKRFRIPIVVGAIGVALVAFLLFRPDKLFVDDRVDESLADAFAVSGATSVPETTVTSTAVPPQRDEATSTTAEPTTTTTAQQGPFTVSMGQFSGIDHRAGGTATVYSQDGKYVLRFEGDTDIQNGPDLYVWVLADDVYGSGKPAAYIDLGKLKGNVGGQNYDLPAEFDPDVHGAVLIWCERFDVPFATAPLT